MRKIQILGLAMFAVFAFSALAAASTFGASEFLLNNVVVKAGDKIEATGELLLSDLALLPAEILCSGILDGEFTGAATGLVTEVLNLAGEKLTELGVVGELSVECTNEANCPGPLLWPQKLPWNFELTLTGMGATEYLLDLGTLKEAAYDVECMNTGITDLCEGLTTFLLSNGVTDILAEKTAAEAEAEKTAKENGNCTIGGTNAADIVTQGEVLISDVPAAGNTLQVSG